MGYESSLDSAITVKQEYIKAVKELIKRWPLKELPWYLAEDNLTIDEKYGSFEFNDTFCKWNGFEDVVALLYPFLEDGNIKFTGEDSERWGWTIFKGKLYNLEFIEKRGSEEIPQYDVKTTLLLTELLGGKKNE